VAVRSKLALAAWMAEVYSRSGPATVEIVVGEGTITA
jgi:hypothetical protein